MPYSSRSLYVTVTCVKLNFCYTHRYTTNFLQTFLYTLHNNRRKIKVKFRFSDYSHCYFSSVNFKVIIYDCFRCKRWTIIYRKNYVKNTQVFLSYPKHWEGREMWKAGKEVAHKPGVVVSTSWLKAHQHHHQEEERNTNHHTYSTDIYSTCTIVHTINI